MRRIRKPRLLRMPADPAPEPDPDAPTTISIIDRVMPVPLSFHVMHVGASQSTSYSPYTVVTRVWRTADDARRCGRCTRCTAKFLYRDGDGDGIEGMPVMCQMGFHQRIDLEDVPLLGYAQATERAEPASAFPRIAEA